MSNTIGEQLKQARLSRGLTLEQISQATHIRKFYLEALENDQRDALPSAVQGRGFLRLVAGQLNLPIEPLLAAWDGKVPPEPPPAAEEILPAEAEVSAPRQDDAAVDAAPPSAETPAPEREPEEAPVEYVLPKEPAPTASADTASAAIFREIGQALLAQREALGLSRAEVERYTRLRVHYVQALEEGHLDQLPSTVQGRGMLSNYAAFLNLDEDRLLLRFAEGLQARRIERIPKPDPQPIFANKRRPARQAPLWRRFLTPDLIIGIGVAGIILLFVIWSAGQINKNMRAAEVKPTPPGISDVLLTPNDPQTGTPGAAQTGTPGAPAETSVSGATSLPQTTGQPGEQITGTAPAVPPTNTPVNVAAGAGSVQTGGQNQVTPQPVTSGTPTLPAKNGDPLQIYIVARQRAWLKVTADDQVKFLGRTIPGNAYAFSGTKKLELTTGNAAALQVFYNQMDLGTLGNTGQVVGLVFSAQGIMTPTAAFTATPTITPPATITPLPSNTPRATPTITPFVP